MSSGSSLPKVGSRLRTVSFPEAPETFLGDLPVPAPAAPSLQPASSRDSTLSSSSVESEGSVKRRLYKERRRKAAQRKACLGRELFPSPKGPVCLQNVTKQRKATVLDEANVTQLLKTSSNNSIDTEDDHSVHEFSDDDVQLDRVSYGETAPQAVPRLKMVDTTAQRTVTVLTDEEAAKLLGKSS